MNNTYTYTNGTPGLKNFIMPTGFSTNVEVHMWGGGGAGTSAVPGGGAGYASSIITINPGDVVQIGVGATGSNRSGGSNGLNGQFSGGAGGSTSDEDNDAGPGYGGGAATVITVNDVIKVVAAGGGGAGGYGDDAAITSGSAGLPGGQSTYITATTVGGDGDNNTAGGGGGGGGYRGGRGGAGVSDDVDTAASPGYGGQSFGTTLLSGVGAFAGGRNTTYAPVAIHGNAGYNGYVVLIFTRSFGFYTKQSSSWTPINNAWVKVNGTWRAISNIYTKVNNVWKPIVGSNSVNITDGAPVVPVPPPVSAAGYTISADTASIDEGGSVTFTVTTTNVPHGTTLYWTTAGTASAPDRFVSNVNSGSFTISYGLGTIIRNIKANHITDGVTSFSTQIRTGSTSGPIQITSSPVVIKDVSLNPTYSISASASSVDEGGTVTFTVTTTDVVDNTTLYWALSGTVLKNRFSDGADSGSVIINNNTASFTRTLRNNGNTDGSTSFTIDLRKTSVTGTVVSSSGTVTVNDTSTTPVPSYTVTPVTSTGYAAVDENGSVTFNVIATNVPDNTTLYWTLTGSVNAADFTDGASSGSFTIISGAGSFTRTLLADYKTESTETLGVNIRVNSTAGSIVATSSLIDIVDSSGTPTGDVLLKATQVLTVPLGVYTAKVSYPTPTGIVTHNITTTPGQQIQVAIGGIGNTSTFGSITAPAYSMAVAAFSGNCDNDLNSYFKIISASGATYSGTGGAGTLAAGAASAGLSYSETNEGWHGDLAASIAIYSATSSTIWGPIDCYLSAASGRGSITLSKQPTAADPVVGVTLYDGGRSEGGFSYTVTLRQTVYFRVQWP